MQTQTQQVYAADQLLECDKCHTDNNMSFVSLCCGHIFCSICSCLMYIKLRKNDDPENSIKCFKCNTITILFQSHLQLIIKTLKQHVLPLLQSDQSITKNRVTYLVKRNSQNVMIKHKTEQDSIQHCDPFGSLKNIFSNQISKSQSPQRQQKPRKNIVKIKQQIKQTLAPSSIIQINKCIKNKSKHMEQIKQCSKDGLQMKEQITKIQKQILKSTLQIQRMLKKSKQVKIQLKNKAEEMLKTVSSAFDEIADQLIRKKQEIREIINTKYQEAIQQSEYKMSRMENYLQQLNCYHKRVQGSHFQLQENAGLLIDQWISIKQKLNQTINQPCKFVQLQIAQFSKNISKFILQISSATVQIEIKQKAQSNAKYFDSTQQKKPNNNKKEKGNKTNCSKLKISRIMSSQNIASSKKILIEKQTCKQANKIKNIPKDRREVLKKKILHN